MSLRQIYRVLLRPGEFNSRVADSRAPRAKLSVKASLAQQSGHPKSSEIEAARLQVSIAEFEKNNAAQDRRPAGLKGGHRIFPVA